MDRRAELRVLDEPPRGLDPLMEVVFRESVLEAKARGQTVARPADAARRDWPVLLARVRVIGELMRIKLLDCRLA